jgi:hypothetical protein
MAAVAFGGNPTYENELRWLQERLVGENCPGKHWPIISKMCRRTGTLWGKQYFEWEDTLPGYGILKEL